MRSNYTKRKPHLVDKHDRENGVVDVPGYAAGGEERQRQVRKDICLTCVRKRETAGQHQSGLEFSRA